MNDLVRLLDHLVGAGKKGLRDHKAERFRSLEIDRKIKFRRSFDGKISRLRAF